MSLRLRLALVFLLLSVLPLSAFAAYSYVSSKTALRAAAQAEAEVTARELEQRVAAATADLDRRLRVLSTVPIDTWVARSEGGGQELAPELAELDLALPYLEGIQFVPELPTPPPAPEAPDPAAPFAASLAAMVATAIAPPVASVPSLAPVAPAPPVAPTPSMPALNASAIEAIRADARRSALFVEIEKLQSAALEAAAAAAKLKGQKLDQLGFERMAAQFEERARQIESAAQARESQTETGVAERARPYGPEASKRERESPHSALQCSVSDGARVVGKLQAKIKGKQLFHSVLTRVDRKRGEIPFAIGAEQALISASADDAARLETIAAIAALRDGDPMPAGEDDWIVVSRQEPTTGFRLGIARPLSGAISELRKAAARNFALGFALVGIATIGFFPLTSRLVRNVRELDRGAARIAAGDFETRVEVRGKDELGRLGASFNRMAEQIAHHQEQLLVEERRRKEEEISRLLLAAENERRGRELEEARQFQLSLLPRELPKVPGLDLAVEMTTATEVGGDYYDFQTATDGELVLAIGDATGHGAAAGTLVTAVKSLFAAAASTESPAAFLVAANTAIHRMGLVRRAMALTVARTRGSRIALSAAGMPPVLHYRAAAGAVDELVLPGTPLGSRAEFPYSEVEIELAPGDALLFVSDGLPELPNGEGEPFGYERLRSLFGQLAGESACEIVSGLRAAARDWGGDRPPVDDVTLLAVRRA